MGNGFLNAVSGSITGFASSVYEGARHTLEQVRAIPEMLKTVATKERPRRLFTHTARIMAQDVMPIIAVNAANYHLQQYYDDETREGVANLAINVALFLAGSATSLFTKKKGLKINARTGLLLAGNSYTFNKTTKDDRQKVDDAVCKDCTNLRFFKGEVRDILAYYPQQLAIDGLRYIPHVGDYIATPLSWILNGQLFLSHRLGNDGICDRHRGVYYQENPELTMSLGFGHDMAVKALTYPIESITGLPAEYYRGPIASLMSLYFVGLVHHMNLPTPVKESKRLQDPLSLIRKGIGITMDVAIPGVKQQIIKLMQKTDEPLPIKQYADWVAGIYCHPKTQSILVWFLPKMLLNTKNLLDDPIVADSWVAIRDGVTETVDTLEGYHEKLYGGVVGFLPKGAKSMAVSYFGDIPHVAAESLVGLLGNEEFMAMLSDIKAGVQRLDGQRGGRSLYPKSVRLNNDGASDDMPVTIYRPRMRTEALELNTDRVLRALDKGLVQYLANAKVNNNSASYFSAGPGETGIKRAKVYQQYLENCRSIDFKLLLLYAFFINNQGASLKSTVLSKTGYIRKAGVLEALKTEIYKRFDASDSSETQQKITKAVIEFNTFANSLPRTKSIEMGARDVYSKVIESMLGEKSVEDSSNVAYLAPQGIN